MILKLSSFKTTKIHYLTVAVDHEFGHGLWLKSFELTVTLGGWGEDTWKGLIRGGSVSQVTSVVLGRIQFLTGCWTGDLSSSLAVGWNSLSAVAAAAESLQSCPTLCYPIGSSPQGSPIPRILQARTLEWGAIAFSRILPQASAKCVSIGQLQHRCWLFPQHE